MNQENLKNPRDKMQGIQRARIPVEKPSEKQKKKKIYFDFFTKALKEGYNFSGSVGNFEFLVKKSC
jgi:hypothetical protein